MYATCCQQVNVTFTCELLYYIFGDSSKKYYKTISIGGIVMRSLYFDKFLGFTIFGRWNGECFADECKFAY